ncbi:MAG TPA: paraquat-inducible protein A [Opitutaceae bacterium]|nr:paraquat-inducible protein A [Opitutaceae bacterium]
MNATTLDRRTRLLGGGMLLASFACNFAVLFLPFMELRKGLGTEPYSLVRSVRMMWGSGLYVLAILVVGFSLVFPFAKLGVLAALCLRGGFGERGSRALEWVERLGKWSMLDVFLVCLILTLTSGQLLVGARPLAGIPLFVAAIMLSLATGNLLAARAEPEPPRAPRIGGWWLTLAWIALGGTLAMPFLQIRDWLLADRAYSIVTLAITLLRSGAWTAGAVVALFLVVAPIGLLATATTLWRRQRRGEPDQRAERHLELWRRWSMLDVFGLALAVFLVEGEQLMRTEVRWGALFLVAMVAARWGLDVLLARNNAHDQR